MASVLHRFWRRLRLASDAALAELAERGRGFHTAHAPTGTIGFMMDCDTTGIEPDLALVKYKLLAGKGDGLMKIVNRTVGEALFTDD